MAEYSKLIITNDGKELVAKSFSGRAKIDFTRVATSSETYEIESLEDLTELIDIKQSSLISKKEITSQSAIKVQTAFTNTDLTVGYYMRAIGLYAKDPDKGEVLYAVTIEKTGNCYMPPYNGVTVSGTHITLITAISNAENVELKVDPAAVATIEQLQLIEIKVDDVLKGISNINNTSDMEKPVSNATRQAIDESYANANGFTQNKIAELINAAPESLNTLKELADAIATNKTIMDAVNEAIGKKASQAELDTHTGNSTIHITATERSKWDAKQDKMTVDSALNVTSTNPIQNKVVKAAIDQQTSQNSNFANSISGLNDSLNDCDFVTEGSGANTKYYIQKGADAASKKLLGRPTVFKNVIGGAVNSNVYGGYVYIFDIKTLYQDYAKLSIDNICIRTTNILVNGNAFPNRVNFTFEYTYVPDGKIIVRETHGYGQHLDVNQADIYIW